VRTPNGTAAVCAGSTRWRKSATGKLGRQSVDCGKTTSV